MNDDIVALFLILFNMVMGSIYAITIFITHDYLDFTYALCAGEK